MSDGPGPGMMSSGGIRFMWNVVAVYIGLVVVASCASFVAYGFDKRRAVSGGRRVPERTLHLLAVIGGWPGAVLGQRRFRHKTKKVRFQIVFWAIVALHAAAVVTVGYYIAGPLRSIAVENAGPDSSDRGD